MKIFLQKDIISEDKDLLAAIKAQDLQVSATSLDCLIDIRGSAQNNSIDQLDPGSVCLLKEFHSDILSKLSEVDVVVVGLPALLYYSANSLCVSELSRPLYCTIMDHIVLCFTGFRVKHVLKRLVDLVHHMGGSVRNQMVSSVTHVIANSCVGDKYRYAVTFGLPVMSSRWIDALWEYRDDREFSISEFASKDYRLKPFYAACIYFVGFSADEQKRMVDIVEANDGKLSTVVETDSEAKILSDNTTHIVVEDAVISEIPSDLVFKSRVFIVKAEWFWASIQMDASADESTYIFKAQAQNGETSPADFLSSSNLLSNSARSMRKRKRLRATVQHLAQGGVSPSTKQPAPKRRSSITDTNLLSTSGSFLNDTSCTVNESATFLPDTCSGDIALTPAGKTVTAVAPKTVSASSLQDFSPRHQIFNEILQTESNYVKILHTIITLFKEPLEFPDQVGGPILETQDIKIIFGNIPPIYEVHKKIHETLQHMESAWKNEYSVGNVFLRHADELMSAYPCFVNFFGTSKETLHRLDISKCRFHAFLKICQSKPDCGRQTLSDLLIRPVQRLPSILLLLNDLLKHTAKNHPDHQPLCSSIERLKEIMTHINEDKRKTESQMALFNIFNEIENCPAHIVSSHRVYVSKCEVIEIKGDILSGRGDSLILYLFSDVLEICKKRARCNTTRSPSNVSCSSNMSSGSATTSSVSAVINTSTTRGSVKPLKHIDLMPLSHVKRVVDIRETDECHNMFALICRSNQELRERHYTFTISSEEVVKETFLRTMCRQMAHVTCRADTENFLTQVDAQDLEIESSDINVNSTLNKVSRFASKTSRKVGRAFSFKQTPIKLRRAVSTVISPFHTSSSSSSHQLGLPSHPDKVGVDHAPSDAVFISPHSGQNRKSGVFSKVGDFCPSSTMPHPRTVSTPRSYKKFKTSALGFSTSKLR